MKKKILLKIIKNLSLFLLSVFLFSLIQIQRKKSGTGVPSKGHIAVVFGAAVKSSGKLFGAILYRTDSAIELYRQGKIKKIIFTGSDKGYRKIGEAPAMGLYAKRQGVPENALILDRNGENTKKSISNISRIIDKNKSLIKHKKNTLFISQGFHLARIELIAKRYGYNGNTYSANGRPLKKKNIFLIREILAYTYTLFFDWP